MVARQTIHVTTAQPMVRANWLSGGQKSGKRRSAAVVPRPSRSRELRAAHRICVYSSLLRIRCVSSATQPEGPRPGRPRTMRTFRADRRRCALLVEVAFQLCTAIVRIVRGARQDSAAQLSHVQDRRALAMRSMPQQAHHPLGYGRRALLQLPLPVAAAQTQADRDLFRRGDAAIGRLSRSGARRCLHRRTTWRPQDLKWRAWSWSRRNVNVT